MQLTLQEEILVVCHYETMRSGQYLLNDVVTLRRSMRGVYDITEAEFREMLRRMVEMDNLLEPWKHQLMPSEDKKIRFKYFIVGDMLGRDPLVFHYKLTPLGWRRQRKLLEDLRKIEGGWKPKKKTDQT